MGNNLFGLFMPAGTATDDSGEEIYYRDVDQKK